MASSSSSSTGRRVLISGASGLLGRQVLAEFVQKGWSATGLAFSRLGQALRKVDLCDRNAVAAILTETQPEVVVHAAAERRPDVVEKNAEATAALNVSATQYLAEECAARGIFLLYISTDYVFDGTQPPYKADAAPNPLNSYGHSKLAGEAVVRGTASLKACILRVPVLYGPVEHAGESAVTVLLNPVLAKKPNSKVNHVQRRYPTHVRDVAAVCCGIADRSLADPSVVSGTHHWSGREMMTKYDMAVVIADQFGLSKDHLVADTEVDPNATPRPHDCQLDCSSLDALGFNAHTLFRDGITAALKEFIPK